MAQDVTSWSEMRQVYRELKKPEVKEVYNSIIIDTVDIAADYCKKYVCDQNDIDDLTDLDYGKGWTKFKDEFNEIFRGLTQLGYSVFFIGHDKEVVEDPKGTKRTVYRPSLSTSVRTVITGMADIYAYAHQKAKGEPTVLTLRDPSGLYDCGCRFKYIPDEIIMSYDNLVHAISSAIDKEAAEHGNKFVSNEKTNSIPTAKVYDFEAMKNEFKTTVATLMQQNQSNAVKITNIVEKYLGKGKKVGDCTPTQCEQLELINLDLSDLIVKN